MDKSDIKIEGVDPDTYPSALKQNIDLALSGDGEAGRRILESFIEGHDRHNQIEVYLADCLTELLRMRDGGKRNLSKAFNLTGTKRGPRPDAGILRRERTIALLMERHAEKLAEVKAAGNHNLPRITEYADGLATRFSQAHRTYEGREIFSIHSRHREWALLRRMEQIRKARYRRRSHTT